MGEIRVTQESRAFWRRYLGSEVEVVMKGRDANMGEQVHRDSGEEAGARDLSWSYSSFLRAAAARAQVASFLQRN